MSGSKILLKLVGYIKNYNEGSDERYFLEVYVQCLKKFRELWNDLPFLPKIMKVEKTQKLVANLDNETEYFIHIRSSRQALNHGLVLRVVHKVIKSNQNAWLNPYIDSNTEMKKKQKPVCLGPSILELSKIFVYEFWYDFVKPKYDEKAKLSVIVYIKKDDIYKNIAEDIETRFDT